MFEALSVNVGNNVVVFTAEKMTTSRLAPVESIVPVAPPFVPGDADTELRTAITISYALQFAIFDFIVASVIPGSVACGLITSFINRHLSF